MSVNNQYLRTRTGQIINVSSLDLDTKFRGNLIPFGDEEHDLGSANNKWHELFVGTIHYDSLDPPVGGGGGNGSSQWITSGSNIYYNLGNVGIGITSPTTKLDVSGSTRINGTLNMNNNNINNVGDITSVNLKGTVCYCDTIDEKSTTGNILVLENLDFATIKSLNRVKDVNSINVNCSTINSTNINSSQITSTSIIVPSTSQLNGVSSGNITNTGNLTSSYIGCQNLKVDGLAQAGNIVAFGSVTCGTLNYTTLNPPISGASKLFFNRLTNITLNGTINTSNQVLLLNGVNGTDYQALVINGFTLDVATSTFTYSGTGTKFFYVQTSHALLIGGSSTSIGVELRKNGSGVSQMRWSTMASGAFLDNQDFNVISLSTGDNISWFYSATTTAATLSSASQTGLAGSTTKPFQIWITEI